ncbi:MAG: hypothetical protein JWM86_201 [Thermoleophilia bacterium]|nr:hypothetical protein [Thermoleophilia bacterium]
MGRSETHGTGVEGLVEGIARFAGAVVELPSVAVPCLPEGERDRVATRIAAGWDLAAFTSTGEVLLQVLDAGGARIEVVVAGGAVATREAEGAEGTEGNRDGEQRGGADFPRATTSHGAIRAARGTPPGRRVAAMGLVPGPSGTVVQMSVGLILRLPATAIGDAFDIARTLAWHAAMHAAERIRMPAEPRLAAALEHVARELEMPRGMQGRVAWATRIADQVAEELGTDALRRATTSADPALRDRESHL